MELKDLKQRDLVELCAKYALEYDVKMNKSDINQYVKGKTEPNQDKLFILSKGLEVSVQWLMGYDYPMNGGQVVTPNLLTNEEQDLLENFRELNEEGQEKVQEYAEGLVLLGKHKKSYSDELDHKKRA